ncbi:MAG TPA: type II and III secretion system protein [Burkholderiales bacterium]|jgi:MSHA biogenesis protein MshL|nr:type II and III secretion system protein [Burkholderiales bacterium]
MTLGRLGAAALLAAFAAGCGHAPPKPAATHIRAPEARAEADIPPPVQVSPILPKPKPAVRPETYSVVVNNVRVQELLFALARDARLNVDINPDVTGTVTLNAIDQTLPQLLSRIARQVDMRYEIQNDNLVVMRDSPYLRTYKVDYLSASRDVKMQSTASTQFGTGGTGVPGATPTTTAGTTTGGTAQIDVRAENKLWESLIQNVKDILRETDKVIPAGTHLAQATPAAPAVPAVPGGLPIQPQALAAPAQPGATYQEAAAVIGNRESGVLYVRATSKQHERVQEFLDQVLQGAKRQVLIEATVAEVQLRNEYQRGIEWAKLRSGVTGFQLQQPAIPPTTSLTPGFSLTPFLLSYADAGRNFSATLSLLEQFGDVRVLSSPRLSVLNNQTAILRVTRDIIYFTLTPSTTPVTVAGGTAVVAASFTTTPNIAAEGFMMAVLPQINDADAVVLNVRPTIRRRVDSVRDPNPALQGQNTQNDIPVFETREFDSILRLQNGEIAVLAGLMQDFVQNQESGIPGVRSIPLIGELMTNRADLSAKTELVIFLRATVIRDPSLEGDFRNYRDQLPREDFFRRPNPSRTAPPLMPGQAP